MIKFILCMHHESGMVGNRLLKSIREHFQNIEQEYLYNVEDLQKRLCSPAYGKEKEIIIVLVDNSERLERLIELKGCLSDRKLVLVLQEEGREILSRCHLLRPRYVSLGENQFSDLLSVLEKMINTSGQPDSTGDGEETTARKAN